VTVSNKIVNLALAGVANTSPAKSHSGWFGKTWVRYTPSG